MRPDDGQCHYIIAHPRGRNARTNTGFIIYLCLWHFFFMFYCVS